MRARDVLLILACAAAFGACSPRSAPSHDASGTGSLDASAEFGSHEGCFLLRNLATGEELTWGTLCDQRVSPCSTFKIPNALIGLDTGAIEGPRHVFRYDGSERARPEWKKDMDLGEAIRVSCVPCFQELARAIGPDRMRSYVDRFGYGNRDTSGGIDRFWLSSSLAISPREQVDFLARLYRNELPVKKEIAETVQRLLVQEEGPGWSWSGKTGSCQSEGVPHGWFVGQVRNGEKEAVFATLMRGQGAFGRPARKISEELLRQHSWLPER